jgi:hypothetical protein
MRLWNYDKRPYRPVFKPLTGADGKQHEQQADVFMDGLSRMWYAGTIELMEQLPADPMREPKIPPQFWHPDLAPREANPEYHKRNRQLPRGSGTKPMLELV